MFTKTSLGFPAFLTYDVTNTSILLIDTTYVIQNVVSYIYIYIYMIQDVL
jgi:hypothetical protein